MARGADVARGTRADATHHARPRGRAARAHAARRWRAGAHRWHGRVAWATRVHADSRWCHVAGELAGEGPTVSGPWLEYWGGNAIVLNRPSFYTYLLPFFSVWD